MTEKVTEQEDLVWEYVYQESDELVLSVLENVRRDGFAKALPDNDCEEDMLAFKVLSMAMVKALALMCEKINHPSLPVAYMQVAPMHADLVKLYVLKKMRQEARS